MSRKRILVILAFCCIAAIIAGSLMPATDKQRLHIEARTHQKITPQITSNHKFIHYAAFGSMALLLLLLSRSRKQEVLALGVTVLLGLCLEILEHVSYGSHFEYWDVFDDALAALGAYAVYWSITTWKPAPR